MSSRILEYHKNAFVSEAINEPSKARCAGMSGVVVAARFITWDRRMAAASATWIRCCGAPYRPLGAAGRDFATEVRFFF